MAIFRKTVNCDDSERPSTEVMFSFVEPFSSAGVDGASPRFRVRMTGRLLNFLSWACRVGTTTCTDDRPAQRLYKIELSFTLCCRPFTELTKCQEPFL